MVAESIMEGNLGIANQFLRGRLPCLTPLHLPNP